MRLLILLFSILLSKSVWSSDIYGQFDCRVLDIKLTVVDKGMSNTYSGWGNSWNVGDNLRLYYKTSHSDQIDFKIVYPTPHKDRTIFMSQIFNSEVFNRSYSGFPIVFKDRFNEFFINRDEVNISSEPSSKLQIKRYDGNKWNGVVVEQFFGTDEVRSHTTSIKCNHNIDNFDELNKFFYDIKFD